MKNLTEKEKGYLFGLFEGDGYLYYHKKSRHYVVEFFLNSFRDGDIIKFLDSLLKKTNLNPFLIKDKRFNCMKIKVNSKKFFDYMKKDYKDHLKNKDFSMGFLSGFIDAEGSVANKFRTIELVNTDFKIMKIICQKPYTKV